MQADFSLVSYDNSPASLPNLVFKELYVNIHLFNCVSKESVCPHFNSGTYPPYLGFSPPFILVAQSNAPVADEMVC